MADAPAAAADRSGTDGWPRAERFVRDNRLTIAVVVPLVGALGLVAADASLVPPRLAYSPLLLMAGTLVMRLPLLVALGPLVDRRAAGVLLALVGFTYAVELVGVTTGLPYGEFVYLRDLGPMLFGRVPLGLPLFFLPLVADAFLLALLLLGPLGRRRGFRLAAALGLLLVVDLVLDPGAVAVGFWAYSGGGAYYGVPLSNYAGWLLTGAVAVVAIDRAFDAAALRGRLRDCEFALDDLASFAVFWGVVNVAAGNLVPAALAVALLPVWRLVTVRPDPNPAA